MTRNLVKYYLGRVLGACLKRRLVCKSEWTRWERFTLHVVRHHPSHHGLRRNKYGRQTGLRGRTEFSSAALDVRTPGSPAFGLQDIGQHWFLHPYPHHTHMLICYAMYISSSCHFQHQRYKMHRSQRIYIMSCIFLHT